MAGRYFIEIDTLGIVVVDLGATALASSFEVLWTNREVTADIDRYRFYFDWSLDCQLVLTVKVGELFFGLVQTLWLDTVYVNSVEWAGTMSMMDWLSTGWDVAWTLRDVVTG